MKATLLLVALLAAVTATAGVAGYVVVGHGSLPFAPAPSSATGTGTLDVLVTSPTPVAPPSGANWSAVYVTFSEVQAQQANATNGSGWHNINLTQANTVNLMSLKTVSSLLGTQTLPAGQYTQLVIVVEKAWGVTTAGKTYNFMVPSGDLLTVDPFNVTTGQLTSVTLSVTARIDATAMGYMLTPVIASIQNS